MCGVVFLSVSVFYLETNIKMQKSAADKKQSDIPYGSVPQNCGLKFVFSDLSAEIVYLDFDNMKIVTLDIEEDGADIKNYRGYSVDRVLYCDFNAVCGIIDTVGGVNLTRNGETLRYTGVQIIELASSERTSAFRKEVTAAVLCKIAEDGLEVSQFSKIIDLCDTDLTVPECLGFSKYIKEMCLRVTQTQEE